jgi:CDP-paratose 2-epimerase
MKTAKLMEIQSMAITGGAGFVGSNLACSLRRRLPQVKVTAIDNLKRRGSELSLPRLRASSVEFVHGDIRCPDDLAQLPDFDLLIDCSAEPSVHAGTKGSPHYVLDTNLTGTIHCLEAARQRKAAFLFLSTSRVYPIASMNAIPFVEDETRFRWTDQDAAIPGLSKRGIGEDYPVNGARSFYGASKLACELLIQEYVESYAIPAIINRCGVLAGPWQMGKVDQGVVTLWVARHLFGLPLKYIGFGGQGKQVRDLLHVDDLVDLIVLQMSAPEAWDGRVYNVGGGREVSVSLLELTELCRRETGREVPIGSIPETSAVDLRIYLSDTRKVEADFPWKPKRSPAQIVHDIRSWIDENRESLMRVFD